MSSILRLRAPAAAASLPILAIYLMYLSSIQGAASPLVANWVEGMVLFTQLLRLLLVISIPRLRFASATLLFVIFSLEVIAMVPLAILSFLLGSAYLGDMVASLFLSWPAAASIVFTPFAIYRLFHDMSAGSRLSSVIPSAAMQFGVVSLLLSAVVGASGPISGLAGLTRQIVMASVSSTPVVELASGDVAYLTLSALLYVALFAHVLFHLSASAGGRLLRPLIVFGSGTLTLAAWVLIGGSLTSSSLYLLVAPCGLLTLVLWWSTRG